MTLSDDWLSAGSVAQSFELSRLGPALRDLDGTIVDPLVKGFPPNASPMPLGAIGSQAWNLLDDDLPLPLAVLKRSALEHNANWMKVYQDRHGVRLAPHAKTTMAPHLWALQGAASCWGLTVATVQQAAVAVRFGCRNIILANQVMGHANLMGLMNLHRASPQVRLLVLVESEAGIEALLNSLRTCGCERPLDVLLEVGMIGGRTGCRDLRMVDRLLDALSGCRERLRLVGISGFEGIVESPEDQRLGQFLDLLRDAAILSDRRNILADDEAILSAGGSAYFDLVVDRLQKVSLSRQTRIVLRSGCYLTLDSREYERHQEQMRVRHPDQFVGLDALQPALFVWSAVQAIPELNRAILTMGKRDVGFDVDMPQPLWRYRRHKMTRPAPIAHAQVFALNDQHAYMRIDGGSDLAIGDLICCGISHPCTTFDRWKMIHVVDDDWTSKGAVMTFF